MRSAYRFLLGILVASIALPAWAAENRQTKLVLNEPTEIPGTVLQPGSYVIRVIDTRNEKEIVQFTSEDQTKVFATVLAVRDYRVFTKGHTEFTYFQRGEGRPAALKTWFYPGDNWGETFVYPKVQATELVAAAQEPVPMTEEEPAKVTSEVQEVTPELEVVPFEAKEPEKTLPATSGDIGLIALLGLAALTGAAAVHTTRTRA
jgi:hypothetical protein